MPLHKNVSGTWKSLKPYINVGGVWKQATVWLNVGGVWKQITSTVSVTLDNVNIFGGRLGAGNVTSQSVTATGSPSGGTYYWSYESGSSFAINSPNSATTTFSSYIAAWSYNVGIYRCTYTQGGNTATAYVTVVLEDTN